MDMISAFPPGPRKDPGWRLWEQVTHKYTPAADSQVPANKDTWHRSNTDLGRSQESKGRCAGT